MEVKMNMPDPPEGYEYTGEFRRANASEPYLETDATTRILQHGTVGMYPILRKIRQWRPVQMSDVGKELYVRWQKGDSDFGYLTHLGYSHYRDGSTLAKFAISPRTSLDGTTLSLAGKLSDLEVAE